LLAAAPAAAQPVVEPRSGVAFDAERVVDGHVFELAGTGLRRKWGFKVYAMAAYVERGGLARARQAGVAPSDPRTLMIQGRFARYAIIHFLRDASRDQIRDELSDGLTDALSDRSPPTLREAARRFLALFDRDVKKGQQITFYAAEDGRFWVDVAGQKQKGPDGEPHLLPAILGIWLGPHAVSDDVRATLVARLVAAR
jgi:hypothetical protein